jgi:hypothetical protein
VQVNDLGDLRRLQLLLQIPSNKHQQIAVRCHNSLDLKRDERRLQGVGKSTARLV